MQGESTYFLSANRGKRSICVDLGDPEGVELVRTLAGRADVVLENFIPGGAERMGLGYEELRARRPSLVYCSISGYPDDGPDAGRPGFDFAIQGEGGIMSITGDADGDPMKVGVAIADITRGDLRDGRGARGAARGDARRASAATSRSRSSTRSSPGSRTARPTSSSPARRPSGSATRIPRSCPTRASAPPTAT